MTVPHLFRAERTATGQTDAFKPAGPGTQVTAQALVTGSGAVSATVKLQGTNTPSLSSSWVDLATLVVPLTLEELGHERADVVA